MYIPLKYRENVDDIHIIYFLANILIWEANFKDWKNYFFLMTHSKNWLGLTPDRVLYSVMYSVKFENPILQRKLQLLLKIRALLKAASSVNVSLIDC